MNVPLCQQQKEIKENNLKWKSGTSESPGELSLYTQTGGSQKKIHALPYSVSSISKYQGKERLQEAFMADPSQLEWTWFLCAFI